MEPTELSLDSLCILKKGLGGLEVKTGPAIGFEYAQRVALQKRVFFKFGCCLRWTLTSRSDDNFPLG